ncbi:hypothetical protein GJ629_10500 [Halapricum sp. CBA1109]|uniref:hypothetical protein n=1 Tax=Halapricum sp. CBA1109 TaxID=2668068 RepID=UPI0012FBEBFE|nr:hypothetical protein [Halapricum sp. CBA1109]MUV90271.1 hypothetical protein [Halapricum sp. CBA1109]
MDDTDTAAAGSRELRRPSPYRVAVPDGAGSECDDVALAFEVTDGRPQFVCTPAADAPDHAVVRTLSPRPGEDRRGLTLPKQCVETAGLRECHTLVYTDGDGRLSVAFDRESRLGSVSLSAVERSFVSRRRGGDLAVSLSESVAGPLAAADSLWFTVDHYGDELFFRLDASPSMAPPGALEVTTNPNTGRVASDGLSILFPRVVGRLCGVGSSTLRWGRTASDNRLLATNGGE